MFAPRQLPRMDRRTRSISKAGLRRDPGEAVPEMRAVSGEYFETLRLPVIEGRAISTADDRDHPLAVVLSATLARQYWSGESPVGRHVRLSKNDPRWLTVVGVCGDTKNWFNTQPEPRAYISFLQFPQPMRRSTSEPPATPRSLRPRRAPKCRRSILLRRHSKSKPWSRPSPNKLRACVPLLPA